MKNKPLRHKETNRFKFKPFSERINEIDIDIFHRVAHRNEDDYDENETYFYQTLRKWNDINLTEGYSNFKKKMYGIITLPQLLAQKKIVIEALLESLRQKNALFLQPILELVIAVARDLQKEFYEYFPDFLTCIVDLLQSKDADQIEYTFSTLAYLFKFLWRYLIKNVQKVFKLVLPLLAETKPLYINNFAAESFAFVVRKVKDKESFFKLVMQILEDTSEGISGCGRLLFEVISGIPGSFHSCAESMMLLYFNALGDTTINQQLLYEVQEKVLECILQSIHPKEYNVLWKVFLIVLDRFSVDDRKTVENKEKELLPMLCHLNYVSSYKNGKALIEPMPLIKWLDQKITVFQNEDNILRELHNSCINILLATNINLMQETVSRIVMKIMMTNNTDLLYESIEKLINYSSFETLILPSLVKMVSVIGLNEKNLNLFSKIIQMKVSLNFSGLKFNEWKKYNLDIHNLESQNIESFLNERDGIKLSENALKMLIIIPHLKFIPEASFNAIIDIILLLWEQLINCESESVKIDDVNHFSFAFLIAFHAIIHIIEPDKFIHLISKENIKFLDMIRKYKKNIFVLNSLDTFITYIIEEKIHNNILNIDFFEELNSILNENLKSPDRQICLIVTHIYSLFDKIKMNGIYEEKPPKGILEILYLAESEQATVHTYREKLLHLQSLEYKNVVLSTFNSKYYEIPLQYLIGNLHINFSLLWDPVCKSIATYSNSNFGQFWSIFLQELVSGKNLTLTTELSFSSEILNELKNELQGNVCEPNFDNYKILLWKCMKGFVTLCEARNRDITGLFIDFVNENFLRSNSEDAHTFNISKYSNETENENVEEDDEDDDEEENNENLKINKSHVKCKTLSTSFKTKFLLTMMEVFSMMTNPRTLYREIEIRKIFLDLLSSKNLDIQKSALNCICTYKYNYLMPYKDHLFGLVNEKNLKNELTVFQSEGEDRVIQKEHRDDLMTILLKILYAKMVKKTGMRTGGKGGNIVRRKLILRFLAGTKENELLEFVNMAFKPFQRYMQYLKDEELNIEEQVHSIIKKIDLTSIVPPKRLQSTINLLGIMIELFGGKMQFQLLPKLFEMLVCVMAVIVGILEKSDQVHTTFLQSIKNARNSSINIFSRFFVHFENYEWSNYEINALFDVAVFPSLAKLPTECIHSPTPLFKLFMAWSENPRYFPLLIKHENNNKSVTPLPFIVQLLHNPQTHRSVIQAILGIFGNLLTLQDFGKIKENDMDIDISSLLLSSLPNLLPLNSDATKGDVNYGSVILLPHVHDILEYIRNRLKKTYKDINKTELIIISRISEFVTDSELSSTLLVLIISVLIKKASRNADEETILEFINTVTNLIKNVKTPEIYIKSINPLLELIHTVAARKNLMNLYNTIAERSSESVREIIIKNSNILLSLNAYDQKWIEQPDFEKRLDTFNKINALTAENELTLELGVAVIYNCYYFLKHENDLATRDYSGQCLKTICLYLINQNKDNSQNRRYLLDDTILMIIRKGINHKNEVVKFQSIALLGSIAINCSDSHPIIRDLSVLADKENPEVDFFENMQHLQLHRRARALLKFCKIARTWKKPPNPKTLTQFILPLASTYLCNESFIHKNSLLDAAIETVGVICKLLPWYHYELILKYYLSKLRSLEFQKQVVRLLIQILNSFHYDLSKCKQMQNATVIAKSENINTNVVTDIKDENEEKEDKNEETENLDENEIEEKFNEDLDKNETDIVEEESNEITNEIKIEEIPAVEKSILLSQGSANKLVFSITKGLLPQLHRTITAKTRYDASHKLNKKNVIAEREEEDLGKIPIALAIVKLLQKLPKPVLDGNLPGIFMRICVFLKSRLESVRRAAREILQQIMITLGPNYLYHLLAEMNILLTKGFQVHVLAFTVHSVLVSLKPYFQPGQMNNNLQSILSVCEVDLFGVSSEEKEVAGIINRVAEAKSTKSFGILQIVAELITESCLLDLLLPLKRVLVKTKSHKILHKITECLRHITIGLADNKIIPLEALLIFVYGVSSESIGTLLPQNEQEVKEKDKSKLLVKTTDCFIVAPEPKTRMGVKNTSQMSKKTNTHIMIEFGLKLQHILLKRETVSKSDYTQYLEPFILVLTNCLKSQYVKLNTLALQCLNWMLKMDLQSIPENISDICNSIFSILHKYSGAGMSKGDNFDLVMAAFKCITVIVRDVKLHAINSDQMKALILYAEQNLYGSDTQSTAFTLLKAIMHRKMVTTELHEIMVKVAELSIVSEMEHVRVQSRSVFYMYIMEYPIGKHLSKHVMFYLCQLEYEMQSGRLSAIQMIHSMVSGFPMEVLVSQSRVIFIMTSVRLINDEDPTCRKNCAKCITELLKRLPQKERNKLFDVTLQWLQDAKVTHKTLATQIAGIFVNVEQKEFEPRLQKLLPILLKEFWYKSNGEDSESCGQFVKLNPAITADRKKEDYSNIKDVDRMKDHHQIQTLQLLLKLSNHCPAFLKQDKYKESVYGLSEYAQSLLVHPHVWVRLAAAQFIGTIMANLDTSKITEALNNPSKYQTKNYLYADFNTLTSLTLDLVEQLHPEMEFQELSDQVVKNLIFIGRILNTVKSSNHNHNDDKEDNENIENREDDENIENREDDENNENREDDENNENMKDSENSTSSLSLLWLLRKLRRSINLEIIKAPKSIVVRTAVFKWIGGIVATIPNEDLTKILFSIMSPLVRELSTTEVANAPLRHLAKEITTLIKKKIGLEAYTEILSRVQQKLDCTRALKKKQRAQQFIIRPDLAAKRKIAQQQKKKEKRRKKDKKIKKKIKN